MHTYVNIHTCIHNTYTYIHTHIHIHTTKYRKMYSEFIESIDFDQLQEGG
jgi:hypothetical protein